VRACESGGRYTAVSANGLYHGAYQFLQETWDWVAGRAGRSDLVGVSPETAAPADQDAMARALWQARGPGQWPVCGAGLPDRP
jgi:resuscitation-promoting factor RpfB